MILILVGVLALVGILYFIMTTKSRISEVEHYKASYHFKANNSTTKEAALLKGETWKIINSYEEYQQFCKEIQEYIMDDIVSDFVDDYNAVKQDIEESKVLKKRKEERLNQLKEGIKKRYEETYQEEYNRRYNDGFGEIPTEKFNEEFF